MTSKKFHVQKKLIFWDPLTLKIRGYHIGMVPKSVVGMNVQVDDEEGDRVEQRYQDRHEDQTQPPSTAVLNWKSYSFI